MTTTQHFRVGDYVSPSPPGDVFPIDCEFPDARPRDGMALVRGVKDLNGKHQILLTCRDSRLRWFEADHFHRPPE